jgi:hypothetical protein
MQDTKLQLTSLETYTELGLTCNDMGGNWYIDVQRLERLKLAEDEVDTLTFGLRQVVIGSKSYIHPKDFDELVSRREVLAEALAVESTLDPSELFIPHSVVVEDPDTGDISILSWYARARDRGVQEHRGGLIWRKPKRADPVLDV